MVFLDVILTNWQAKCHWLLFEAGPSTIDLGCSSYLTACDECYHITIKQHQHKYLSPQINLLCNINETIRNRPSPSFPVRGSRIVP